MQPKYGRISTTTDTGDGSEMITISDLRDGERINPLTRFVVEQKVTDTQQELTEIIRFTDELRTRREQGKLHVNKFDRDTLPSISWKFPNVDKDGSYLLVLSWTERA